MEKKKKEKRKSFDVRRLLAFECKRRAEVFSFYTPRTDIPWKNVLILAVYNIFYLHAAHTDGQSFRFYKRPFDDSS